MTTFKLDVLSKKHPNVEDFNSCWYVSDLWVISFHAVIVFGLGKDLLIKYAGMSQGLKIWGGVQYWVGIMCPPWSR